MYLKGLYKDWTPFVKHLLQSRWLETLLAQVPVAKSFFELTVYSREHFAHPALYSKLFFLCE